MASATLTLGACEPDDGEPPRTECDSVSYNDVYSVSDMPAAEARLCMPRSFIPDAEGHVPCVVVEASVDPACACDAPKMALMDQNQPIVDDFMENAFAQAQGFDCFCELPQTRLEALDRCQGEVELEDAETGFCYVDAVVQPPVGNPTLAAACNETHARVLRVVGSDTLAPNSALILHCAQPSGC